jgi:hypothetical protein
MYKQLAPAGANQDTGTSRSLRVKLRLALGKVFTLSLLTVSERKRPWQKTMNKFLLVECIRFEHADTFNVRIDFSLGHHPSIPHINQSEPASCCAIILETRPHIGSGCKIIVPGGTFLLPES